MSEPTGRSGYSELQLREIIARAAVQGEPLYSDREIHDIGAELGIDAQAIDAAIAAIGARSRQSESRAIGLVRYTTYGATLGFAGAAGLLTPGVESIALITCGAMLAVSSALARPGDVPKSSAVAAFLRRNFVAWGSFIIGGTTFARLADPIWLGNRSTATGLTIAGLWIASSVVGAFIARKRTPPGDPSTSLTIRPSWRVRLASTIKRWVDAVLLQYQMHLAIPAREQVVDFGDARPTR